MSEEMNNRRGFLSRLLGTAAGITLVAGGRADAQAPAPAPASGADAWIREGKGTRGRNRAGQAHDGRHSNRKRAAHMPVLLSHQPPAISTSDCLASRVWIG